MTAKQSFATGMRAVRTGLAMGESPRWHQDRLWFSDWGAQEIVAVDVEGRIDVAIRVTFALPFCIDWLPDGRLLVVSGREGLLMRREPDGSLATHADLQGLSVSGLWNEIVVDGRGNIFINGSPGIALLATDGSVRQVVDSFAFPNGMAITSDNSTLIIAESHGKKLTAFDISAEGNLSNRRIWADLGSGVPDGICIDADGAVWYADVPNKRCVRVREGGAVLQAIDLDRGCFACMLGGPDGRRRGMEHMTDGDKTGQVLAVRAPAPGAGWP